MSLGYGLGARIHFLENVTREQVGAYYAGATLFVHPARREAFGIVILEAGVLKKPLVACGVGGIREILRHRENGILVAPDDDGALGDAIALLLEDRELGKRLGEELYRDVCRRFTWSRAWGEYLAVAGIGMADREELQVP
jgi:glycosyltransferase involved in cell wall biosynthesis